MGSPRRPDPVELTARTLARVEHATLRAEAEGALARGERILLLVGASAEGGRVETLVMPGANRAVQSGAGSSVVRGSWSGERLLVDGSDHSLDLDGSCFCPRCELAAGFFGDDDE